MSILLTKSGETPENMAKRVSFCLKRAQSDPNNHSYVITAASACSELFEFADKHQKDLQSFLSLDENMLRGLLRFHDEGFIEEYGAYTTLKEYVEEAAQDAKRSVGNLKKKMTALRNKASVLKNKVDLELPRIINELRDLIVVLTGMIEEKNIAIAALGRIPFVWSVTGESRPKHSKVERPGLYLCRRARRKNGEGVYHMRTPMGHISLMTADYNLACQRYDLQAEVWQGTTAWVDDVSSLRLAS